jgi:hypothetical protein
MKENRAVLSSLIGLVAIGSSLTGVLGLLGALITFFLGEYVATAGLTVAAALAFGLLANALFRE